MLGGFLLAKERSRQEETHHNRGQQGKELEGEGDRTESATLPSRNVELSLLLRSPINWLGLRGEQILGLFPLLGWNFEPDTPESGDVVPIQAREVLVPNPCFQAGSYQHGPREVSVGEVQVTAENDKSGPIDRS